MLRGLRHSRASLWIAAFYALAMATLGVAHRPVAPAAATELAAYALPDGTLPTLCAHDDAQGPAGVAPQNCDACALASAPGLIPPHQSWLSALVLVRRVAWIDPHGQFRAATRPAPVSRGPPGSALLTV